MYGFISFKYRSIMVSPWELKLYTHVELPMRYRNAWTDPLTSFSTMPSISGEKLTFCSRLYVFSSLRWRHLRAACLFLTRLTSRFSSSAGDNSLSANFAFRPGLFFDKGRNLWIDVLSKCSLLFWLLLYSSLIWILKIDGKKVQENQADLLALRPVQRSTEKNY